MKEGVVIGTMIHMFNDSYVQYRSHTYVHTSDKQGSYLRCESYYC